MTIISEDPIKGCYFYDEYSDTVYKTDCASPSAAKLSAALAGVLTFLLFAPAAIVLTGRVPYRVDLALSVLFFTSVIFLLAYVRLQKLYCRRAQAGKGRELIRIELPELREIESARGVGVDRLYLPSAVFQYIMLAAIVFLIALGVSGYNSLNTTILCVFCCAEIFVMHRLFTQRGVRRIFKNRLRCCIEAEEELM